MKELLATVTDSVRWTWTNRSVWILGILLALFSGNVIDYSSLHIDLHIGIVGAPHGSQMSATFMLIVLFMIVVFSFVISNWVTVLLMRVGSTTDSSKFSLQSISKFDFRAIGNLILYGTAIPYFVIALCYLISVPLLFVFYSLVGAANPVVIYIIAAILLALLIAALVSAVTIWLFFIFGVITEQLKVREALLSSWALFKKNAANSILLLLIAAVSYSIFRGVFTYILDFISSSSEKLFASGNYILGYVVVMGYFLAFIFIVFVAALISIISITSLVRWYKKIANA